MKLSDFDKIITLARNETTVIGAVRWGQTWRFFMQHLSDSTGYTVGAVYNCKQKLLNNAYDYILKQSHCNFKDSDLLSVVPKLTTITLTQDQQVAINTAINLISNSNSSHADQCYFYLKQISEKF